MKKRTEAEKIEGINNALESHAKFGADYVPSGDDWTTPDENFRYRRTFFHRILTAFWRTAICIFGPLLIKFLYGYKVTGKKNLKKIKGTGAVSICNHIAILDTLFVRQAVGHFRSFHTVAETNNKTGFVGHIVYHGGSLPFSHNYTASKNLLKEMDRLLKKGKIINIYPEKAMWLNYQKPRPMLPGAFNYSVRFNVPVLPVFCTFGHSKKGKIKKLRINILPPVFPDLSLPAKQRMVAQKEACEKEWRECYEKAYGIPLEYSVDPRYAPAP